MGIDWYRIEYISTEIPRNYNFSDWLYEKFDNDKNGICLSYDEFIKKINKENKEFKKEYKEIIEYWKAELGSRDINDYYDYLEV
jgi:hypothetical protein